MAPKRKFVGTNNFIKWLLWRVSGGGISERAFKNFGLEGKINEAILNK